jgi:hypothetical protein
MGTPGRTIGTKRARIPALGYRLLTPLYAPLMRVLRAPARTARQT